MQNPVGFRINEAAGRAELTDFGAVLTNPVTLVTVPHVLAGCFLVAGAFVVAVAAVAPDAAAPTRTPTRPGARRCGWAG